MIYFHDLEQVPITCLLRSIPQFKPFDLVFVVFAVSANADEDQQRSPAWDIQFFQGGLVDHISWEPNPIPLLSAESESNCYLAAIMRMRYIP